MNFTSNLSIFLITSVISIIAASGLIYGYLYGIAAVGIVLLLMIKIKYEFKEVFFIILLFCATSLSVFYTSNYTPILYFIFIFIVLISLKKYEIFKLPNNYVELAFFFVFLVFFVQYLFIPISNDGRFRGVYGDPNFVSLWFFSVIYFLYTLNYHTRKNLYPFFLSLVLIFSVFVIYLTQSRMAILAVLVFIFSLYLVEKKKFFLLRFFVSILLLSSIFLQYFLYFVFTGFVDVGNNLNDNPLDRMLNLNDTSNLARVISAYNGLNLFFSQNYWSIMFGDPALFNDMKAIGYHVPHNWFIQSLFMFGAIITSLISLLFFRIILRSPPKALPFVSLMIIMGAILSLVVIPVLFLLLSIILMSKKRIGNI